MKTLHHTKLRYCTKINLNDTFAFLLLKVFFSGSQARRTQSQWGTQLKSPGVGTRVGPIRDDVRPRCGPRGQSSISCRRRKRRMQNACNGKNRSPSPQSSVQSP
ncbi:hypothetical protein TRVL_01128 [Trypanosoma vivax]|nr:hypothetical protein TRVL_01128 [Trypanosoma vivax]